MGESSAAARVEDLQVMIDLEEATQQRVAQVDRIGYRRVTLQAGIYQRWVKPIFDRGAAALLLLITMPLLLALGLAVRMSLGSPVIFRQQRVGRGGVEFTLYKFRTMTEDRRTRQAPFEGPDRRRRHKTPHDPRITDLGAVLRRLSLDELPQLMNVLRGDMSLVGPRPEVSELVKAHYEAWQLQRHLVKPGITGLWQVSSRASGLIYEDVDLDLDYVEQMSFRTDLRILMSTAAVLVGRLPGC